MHFKCQEFSLRQLFFYPGGCADVENRQGNMTSSCGANALFPVLSLILPSDIPEKQRVFLTSFLFPVVKMKAGEVLCRKGLADTFVIGTSRLPTTQKIVFLSRAFGPHRFVINPFVRNQVYIYHTSHPLLTGLALKQQTYNAVMFNDLLNVVS